MTNKFVESVPHGAETALMLHSQLAEIKGGRLPAPQGVYPIGACSE